MVKYGKYLEIYGKIINIIDVLGWVILNKKTKIIILIAVDILALTAVSFGTYKYYEGKSVQAYQNNVVASVVNPTEKIVESTTVEVPKPEPPKVEVKLPRLSEVTMNSAGDCTIGTDTNFGYSGSYIQVFNNNNRDYNYFFKNVYDIFKNDDITTVNLETTFTNETTKVPKKFNFKASPEMAEVLTSSSIEAVNISNNHIMDYGTKGFQDTIETLKSYKINYFGEGTKYVTEIKGVKFGFLGYKGFEDSKAFYTKLRADILELKNQNCIVVINFHWGIERSYSPNKTQKELAHFSIDNGADLIIGHHPHVIQGLEKYKGKIIAYSLGNFSFGGNRNPSDKDTFILQTSFKFENEKLKSYGIKVIPYSVSSVDYKNDYCPTPLQGNKKTALLNKLNKLSFNLGFTLSDSFSYIEVNN
jgi:poly-gamma-glutamate synthesis protein (capsule biosynthesis protein)